MHQADNVVLCTSSFLGLVFNDYTIGIKPPAPNHALFGSELPKPPINQNDVH